MERTITPLRKRSHQNQLDELVFFMEQHSEFAKGHITKLGPSGSDKNVEMWNRLTALLNQQGPVTKVTTGWQRTWTHLRRTAKHKKAAYIVAMNRTGNDETIKPLSQRDIQISAIFGKYSAGLCLVREIGVHKKRKPKLEVELDKQLNMHASSDEEIHWLPIKFPDFNLPQMSIKKCEEELSEIMENFAGSVAKCLRILDSKTKNRPTKKQISKLVNFMEHNLVFAKGESNETVADIKWNDLVDKLNGLGPPHRNRAVWQRTWTDLQTSAERAAISVASGKRKKPLRELDLQVLDIVKPKTEDQDSRSRSRSRSPLNRIKRDPATIDLTSDCENTKPRERTRESNSKKEGRPRQEASEKTSAAAPQRVQPSQRPATSTGSNTSAVIQVMNAQTQLQKKMAQEIVDCFKRQNEVLKKGFEDVGEKIVQAVQGCACNSTHRPNNLEPKYELEEHKFEPEEDEEFLDDDFLGDGTQYELNCDLEDDECESNLEFGDLDDEALQE